MTKFNLRLHLLKAPGFWLLFNPSLFKAKQVSNFMGTKTSHHERPVLRVCASYSSVMFTNGSRDGYDKLHFRLRARCRCTPVYICECAY